MTILHIIRQLMYAHSTTPHACAAFASWQESVALEAASAWSQLVWALQGTSHPSKHQQLSTLHLQRIYTTMWCVKYYTVVIWYQRLKLIWSSAVIYYPGLRPNSRHNCTFAIGDEQQDLCHTHLGFAGTCSFIIVVNSSALNMLCMLPVAHATMATQSFLHYWILCWSQCHGKQRACSCLYIMNAIEQSLALHFWHALLSAQSILSAVTTSPTVKHILLSIHRHASKHNISPGFNCKRRPSSLTDPTEASGSSSSKGKPSEWAKLILP